MVGTIITMFVIWKETDILIGHQVPTDLAPRGSNSDPEPHPQTVMSGGWVMPAQGTEGMKARPSFQALHILTGGGGGLRAAQDPW